MTPGAKPFRERMAARAAAFALPLLLGACAALQPVSPPPPTSAADRQYQQTLNLGGRLSVRYETRSGEQALHGSFAWQQDEANTKVTLFSPLGQALAQIQTSPAGASLRQAGQTPIFAEDVGALTEQALGWPLPVGGLRDWLQGFAVDAQGRRFIATPSAKAVTTHDGWRIEYPTWQDDGAGVARPRRIDLARNTTQAGDVAIRIVIDTWQIP